MQDVANTPHWFSTATQVVMWLGGLAGITSFYKVFFLDRKKQASEIDLSDTQRDLAKAQIRKTDAETVGSTIDKLEAAAIRTEALREERDKLKDELQEARIEIKQLKTNLELCKSLLGEGG